LTHKLRIDAVLTRTSNECHTSLVIKLRGKETIS
jgi:hypothetical protein